MLFWAWLVSEPHKVPGRWHRPAITNQCLGVFFQISVIEESCLGILGPHNVSGGWSDLLMISEKPWPWLLKLRNNIRADMRHLCHMSHSLFFLSSHRLCCVFWGLWQLSQLMTKSLKSASGGHEDNSLALMLDFAHWQGLFLFQTCVTAFSLHAVSLSHGCTEAGACSKSSWPSPNSLSGSCCSLHVAGLRQELVWEEIGLKPLDLSWLLPSGALLASGWFRRQSFPSSQLCLGIKIPEWYLGLTRKAAARVFEKPSLYPAIHHPIKLLHCILEKWRTQRAAEGAVALEHFLKEAWAVCDP